MRLDTDTRIVLEAFVDLLDYPTGDLAERVAAVRSQVQPYTGEADESFALFQAFLASSSRSAIEEVYSGAFDLNAALHPYVGYHLFGESYKRSAFMLGLAERYNAHGFAHEGELADHLGVMLRFVAALAPLDEAAVMIREAILPVLDRMTGNAPLAELPPIAEQDSGTGQGCATFCESQPPKMDKEADQVPLSKRQRSGNNAYRSLLRALFVFLDALAAPRPVGAGV